MGVSWSSRLSAVKSETYAVYLACRHPGTPWYVKAIAACTLAYALSPIDLIPDFIPVLGHLDDLLIVPAGIWLVYRLMPRSVLQECRAAAAQRVPSQGAGRWIVAGAIILVWAGSIALVAWIVARATGHWG